MFNVEHMFVSLLSHAFINHKHKRAENEKLSTISKASNVPYIPKSPFVISFMCSQLPVTDLTETNL